MRTLTLLLLALVLVAGATTVTFQPDATVGKDADCIRLYDGSYGDTNYGNSSTLWFGESHHGFDQYRTFIEFTELNDSAYQGATVASASLWLYVYDVSGTGANGYWLGVASTEWDESTITYNNRPGVDTAFSFDGSGDNSWWELDVTDHVQSWLDGTRQNYGFGIGPIGTSMVECYSSDYSGDPTLRPKLVLEYYGAAVEEATWGEIKAGI